FFADTQRFQLALPDLLVHHGRQSCGCHNNPLRYRCLRRQHANVHTIHFDLEEGQELATLKTAYHHGDLRTALIDAGLALTRTGGPEALTIREATRQVGVSPNAAYRHFVDREALLGAVATAIQHRMAARMARTHDANASDRLRAV